MLHFCRPGDGVPVFQVDSGAELLGCEQMCSLFRTRCNRQQPAPALHSPHLAVQPLTPPRRVLQHWKASNCNVIKAIHVQQHRQQGKGEQFH